MPYINRLFGEAQRLYEGQAPSFYPGQTYAGLQPEEQQAQGQVRQVAANQIPEVADWSQQAFARALNPVKAVTENPALEAATAGAVRPLYQNLTEQVLPAIRGNAVAGGNLGSSRTGIAEGLAAGRTAQAAADVTAGLQNQAYNTAQQGYTSALGLAPMIQQLQLAGPEALAAVGTQNRTVEQQAIDEAIARHTYGQNLPYQRLNEYANTIAGSYGGTGTSTVEGPPPSTAAQVTGGITGILSLLSLLRGLGLGG